MGKTNDRVLDLVSKMELKDNLTDCSPKQVRRRMIRMGYNCLRVIYREDASINDFHNAFGHIKSLMGLNTGLAPIKNDMTERIYRNAELNTKNSLVDPNYDGPVLSLSEAGRNDRRFSMRNTIHASAKFHMNKKLQQSRKRI